MSLIHRMWSPIVRILSIMCRPYPTSKGPLMKRSVIALLALWTLAGPPAVGAADDPNKVPAPSKKTPKEQIQELSDAYEKAMRDYSRAYAKAATDEERTKARQIAPGPTSTPPVSWRSPMRCPTTPQPSTP